MRHQIDYHEESIIIMKLLESIPQQPGEIWCLILIHVLPAIRGEKSAGGEVTFEGKVMEF